MISNDQEQVKAQYLITLFSNYQKQTLSSHMLLKFYFTFSLASNISNDHTSVIIKFN